MILTVLGCIIAWYVVGRIVCQWAVNVTGEAMDEGPVVLLCMTAWPLILLTGLAEKYRWDFCIYPKKK